MPTPSPDTGINNAIVKVAYYRTIGRDDAAEAARDALLVEFGLLNGWRVTDTPFTLNALTLARASAGGWGDFGGFPLCDHATYFLRGARPIAVVVEPYAADLGALEVYASARGLAVHSPHNRRASFWWPSSTLFAVVTRRGGPSVTWLRDQREFGFRRDHELPFPLRG